EEAASQLEGRWGAEKGLQYQPGEGAPVVQEAAIGVPLPGELPLQLLCRALRVTMDEEGVPVGVRGEEEGVQLEVFEPVALQLQLLDHGGEADEDVRAAAEVEPVAGDDLLRGHRSADQVTALEHRHTLACPSEIRGGHKAV